MWVWLDGQDEPVNLYIPEDAPSSTGEFEDLRSEISHYWTDMEQYLATGDDSELGYFTGAYLVIDDNGHVRDTDEMRHDADGSPILDQGDRVVTFQLDRDLIEDVAESGDLDFETIDSGGGQ